MSGPLVEKRKFEKGVGIVSKTALVYFSFNF